MKINETRNSRTVSAILETLRNNTNKEDHTGKIVCHKRKFDRSLLPAAARYYCEQFPGLNHKSGWASVNCCFHKPDKNPSLSISMTEGCFKCFACDRKGGDIISFHMQRYQMTFPEVVSFMGAWGYE